MRTMEQRADSEQPSGRSADGTTGGRRFPPTRPAGSAVDKALDLIEATARSDRGLRLSELAEQVGLHRATAYRILADLVRRNWVLRYDGRYLPGTVLLQLSQQVSGRSIATLCRPVLQELADRTGMMANLQVLEPDGSRVVDAVRPPRYAVITDLVGELLPAHRFAGPLALVAALTPQRQEHYLRLAAAAGHPVDGPGGLREELVEVRRTGYALVRRRNDDVVASMSRVVPSPAEDPLCALTVIGLDAEFDDPRQAVVRAALAEAVTDIQRRLTQAGQPDHSTTRDEET